MSQDAVNPDEILNEARILNSELGRHVRKCSFSTHLSGRFYANHSLQSNKIRAQRIAQMKAKRNELEKCLLMEEKKIRLLEEELKKKIEERKRENEMKIIMDRAATIIQCVVRRMLAINKVDLIKIEEQIMNYLAIFLQAVFRGRKARQYVQCIRQQLAQKQKEELASIRIQNFQRCRVARRLLAEARQQLGAKKVRSACIIQARMRGILARKLFLKLLKHHAAIIIQCFARRTMARELVRKRKLALEREKRRATPKRIPLYKKRYSAYSVDVTTIDTNDIGCSTLEEDTRHQRQQWKSRKKESSQSLDEKITIAQQRASMRVAKLKVIERLAKEKEEEQAALRKKELERLEIQRRAMMAQEEENRRKLQSEKKSDVVKEQVMDPSTSVDNTESGAHSIPASSVDKPCNIATNEQRCTARTEKHKGGGRAASRDPSKDRKIRKIESVKKIKIMDLSYCWDDGDFDEDTCEDENDLSSKS